MLLQTTVAVIKTYSFPSDSNLRKIQQKQISNFCDSKVFKKVGVKNFSKHQYYKFGSELYNRDSKYNKYWLHAECDSW